jgi:type VI secretion system protein ImpM
LSEVGCAGGGARIAGWYGKLPCLRDFASRRLPGEFIAAWDGWLQRSIAGSRERLHERWLDAFLTSPMWRFAVGPGVFGETAWTGLLLPSVDKVGRYFPLTFAACVPASALAYATSNQAWYAGLEDIALSALRVDFTIAALEDELRANPLTFDVSGATPASASDISDWLRNPAPRPLERQFSTPDALVSAIHGGTPASFGDSVIGRSFWWCVEHDSGAAELHCALGLPDVDQYTLLLRSLPASGMAEMPQ